MHHIYLHLCIGQQVAHTDRWGKQIKECIQSTFSFVFGRTGLSYIFLRHREAFDKANFYCCFLFTIATEAMGTPFPSFRPRRLDLQEVFKQKVRTKNCLTFNTDDILLFSQTNWEEIVNLKSILQFFKLSSSSKIKLNPKHAGGGCMF